MLFNKNAGFKAKALKGSVVTSFALALVVGAQPVAANAAEGSDIGFSSVSLDYRSASVSTGVSVYNSQQPTKSYQWYKCAAKTDFIAMVPPPSGFGGSLVVVNSQAVLDGKLSDAGCVVLAGKVDESISVTEFYNANGTLKDAAKPFLTVTTLVTPPQSISQLPHSGIANGAYLRTSTKPIPGMEKVGKEYVSTDPTFNNGVGDPVITPTNYFWYACDSKVVAGSKLHEWMGVDISISDTPVANCQKLFTSWEMGEGWMGVEVTGLRFEPAAGPVYTNDPANPYVPLAVNDVPTVIDLEGKYLVRSVDAYPYFGWSNGVMVNSASEENPDVPGTDGGSEELAETGATSNDLLFVALAVLLAGFSLLAFSRKKRNI